MPNDAQIRQRAYQLWQRAGSPEGREHDFWFQAEQEIVTEAMLLKLGRPPEGRRPGQDDPAEPDEGE